VKREPLASTNQIRPKSKLLFKKIENLPENLPHSAPVINTGNVSDYYKQLIAQVDDVIEKTKVKQEVEWKLDPEILALLQTGSQKGKAEENDWSLVIEDDIITGVKNIVTGVQKSLKLPVIITPKILVYDAYEEL